MMVEDMWMVMVFGTGGGGGGGGVLRVASDVGDGGAPSVFL